MDAEHVDTPTLRRLLAELLRTVPEFDAFCLDYFPEVHRQLGPGMERTQKENLLLQQAPSRAAIVQALQAKFAEAPIWASLATEPAGSKRAMHPPAPWLRALFSAAVLVGMALATVVVWVALRSPQPSPVRAVRSPGTEAMQCGALALDDVFVVRESRAEDGESIQLDLRLRHIGTPAGPVNLSRVQVDCSHRIEERAPLAVSATYDLLITGEHNQAALAQRLSSGEVDRIVLRLGFTQETAAYQYTATLRLLYNGTCTVESEPFTLSRDAARHPALVAPWPGKPAEPVRH